MVMVWATPNTVEHIVILKLEVKENTKFQFSQAALNIACMRLFFKRK